MSMATAGLHISMLFSAMWLVGIPDERRPRKQYIRPAISMFKDTLRYRKRFRVGYNFPTMLTTPHRVNRA